MNFEIFIALNFSQAIVGFLNISTLHVFHFLILVRIV
jgi:hypothetical protein